MRGGWFENGRQPEVFVGSADWMPRNLFRRIEVVFPVEDGNLRDRITGEILGRQLADNVKARLLQPDGRYVIPPLAKGVKPRRSQSEFMELAAATPKPNPGKEAKATTIQVRKRPD